MTVAKQNQTKTPPTHNHEEKMSSKATNILKIYFKFRLPCPELSYANQKRISLLFWGVSLQWPMEAPMAASSFRLAHVSLDRFCRINASWLTTEDISDILCIQTAFLIVWAAETWCSEFYPFFSFAWRCTNPRYQWLLKLLRTSNLLPSAIRWLLHAI